MPAKAQLRGAEAIAGRSITVSRTTGLSTICSCTTGLSTTVSRTVRVQPAMAATQRQVTTMERFMVYLQWEFPTKVDLDRRARVSPRSRDPMIRADHVPE
jgi:hypothetical protein